MAPTDKKETLAVVFGGRSGEHEVSLVSAKSVMAHIDTERFFIQAIAITKNGEWTFLPEGVDAIQGGENPRETSLTHHGIPLSLDFEPTSPFFRPKNSGSLPLTRPDVVFPLLHGPFGEDGTVQGLLECAQLPYIGAGVYGSAAAMDKLVTKQVMHEAGINTAPFLPILFALDKVPSWQQVQKTLGGDVFVKPANLGSSVGINHATSESEYKHALEEAKRYDHRALVEKTIPGREVACAVLGNDRLKISGICEIKPASHHDFYTYDAKYVDPNGVELVIPADVSVEAADTIKKLTEQSYVALNLSGLARVDAFIERGSEKIWINEINTIPGFTSHSIYPALWRQAGLTTKELINELADLAIDRFRKTQSLTTSYL